jgi:hypothetical protein
MKRIYNTETEETLWRGDEYLIDGQPGVITAPLILLTETRLPDPQFDPATEALVSSSRVDLEDLFWIDEATVRQLTSEELAALARKVWQNNARYLAEFTFTEMAQISLSPDPTIAALRLLLASWDGEVWSDDPRVIAGLDALELNEIIDEDRRAEILAK